MRINKITIFVLIILTPIIISQIIRLPFAKWTIGDENSWVGFFGGYIGGIIGGLVAFFVARYQINEQLRKQIANEEILKFISQMPALMKLRYELENVNDSLKSVLTYINENMDAESDDWVLEYKDMHVPYEQYWNAIDQLDSVDLSTNLLSIKFKYQQVSQAFMYDFFLQDSMRKRLEREVFNIPGADFEKLANAEKVAKEYTKMFEFKVKIITGEAIPPLIKGVEDTLDIINMVLHAIEDEKEHRHKIRDSIPPG